MRVWSIFKKEVRLYFVSPIAYVVFAIFALVSGVFFYGYLIDYAFYSMRAAMSPMLAGDLNITEGVMRPLLQHVIAVIMLFVLPLLTMRLFAEEKKVGTIELLLTYPVRDGEVLLGKYLAALALFLGMLVLTLCYPILVGSMARLEWGPLLSGYLGLVLQGAAFLAAGVLISSLTENQVVAAVATFGILLLLWVAPSLVANFVGSELARILAHLSMLEQFEGFAKGVIDTKAVVYYLNFTLLCLFLTLRSLESKRWRG
ncbi:MAG: ABC transporter permease subunit [Candidatus Rokubacteria bacterium]|nr:ABC transporter permease subunit [Candidatus Rokubacteria bacterium]